jgi:hypothetical protein
MMLTEIIATSEYIREEQRCVQLAFNTAVACNDAECNAKLDPSGIQHG